MFLSIGWVHYSLHEVLLSDECQLLTEGLITNSVPIVWCNMALLITDAYIQYYHMVTYRLMMLGKTILQVQTIWLPEHGSML